VYDTLSADLKNDLESLVRNFKAYFGKTELDYVFADETVFTQVQRPNEKSRYYCLDFAFGRCSWVKTVSSAKT